MMQKLSESGVPGELWDQHFDPQYHAQQTLLQQRFHQQRSPTDGSHAGEQHVYQNSEFWIIIATHISRTI
jgi:hypothetical protein